MLIRSMQRQASIDLLVRAKVGRLACAHEGQPYITPLSFVYDDAWLYSFSTLGRKIAWMRANPLVCLEADEIVSRQAWATVIVLGRYEELTKSDHGEERAFAYKLLQARPLWWEPAYVKTVIPGQHRTLDEAVFFRILISEITGREAVPD